MEPKMWCLHYHFGHYSYYSWSPKLYSFKLICLLARHVIPLSLAACEAIYILSLLNCVARCCLFELCQWNCAFNKCQYWIGKAIDERRNLQCRRKVGNKLYLFFLGNEKYKNKHPGLCVHFS